MSYQIGFGPKDGDILIVTRTALEALVLIRNHARPHHGPLAIATLDGEPLTLAELETRALEDARIDTPQA